MQYCINYIKVKEELRQSCYNGGCMQDCINYIKVKETFDKFTVGDTPNRHHSIKRTINFYSVSIFCN
jgi:hypothetical protein